MERSEHSVCLLTHRIFVPMLDTDCDYRLSYVLSVRFSPPDKKVEKGRGVNWSPRLFSIARRRRYQEPVSVIARLTCEDADQITTVAQRTISSGWPTTQTRPSIVRTSLSQRTCAEVRCFENRQLN
jgi:hypothetical protein